MVTKAFFTAAVLMGVTGLAQETLVPDAGVVQQLTPTEVTVHGNRADTIRRAASSSTNITEHEIRQAQPVGTGEMIRRVPGVQVREEDGSGLRLNIGIRGMSPVRSRLVLLEEDGVPVVVSPYGEPELYYSTDVSRVQSLDVLKGADVLRHGPQTVGAVVQLHTWEPTEGPSLLVSGTIGSNLFGEGLARYADTYRGIGYVVQAMYKGSEGVRAMGFHDLDLFGKVHFATSDRGELTVKLGFHSENSRTTYTGLTSRMFRDDPTQDTIAPDDRFGITRAEASVSHTQHLNEAFTLRSAIFAYTMTLEQRLQDFDRTRLPDVAYVRIPDSTALFFRGTDSLRHRVYDVAGISTELEARASTGPVQHKLTVGGRLIAENSRRQLSSGAFPTAQAGDLLTDDTTGIIGVAAWAEDQLSWHDLVVLTPAIRLEHASLRKTTYRIQDDATAPRDVNLTGTSSALGIMPGIGLGVGGPRLTGFASVYSGYSGPRVSQAITPDGRDTNLNAEHSVNFEIGARGRIGNIVRAEVDGFLVNFDNQLVSNNPLSGSNSEFVNGGRTRHLGAEATATFRVGALAKLPIDLDFAGHYTFVSSRFVGGTFDGHTIPYSPQNTAQITLDAAHHSGLSAQLALIWVGQQYSDELNSIEPGPSGLDGLIPSSTVLDVGAKYHHERTGLTLGVSVKNLLNQISISDRLPNGIFTSGFRQFFVTLSWHLGS